MSLKHVKNKIKATERTGKVTKAMEAVSAVKMRKSQERALGGRAYAESALRILSRVSNSTEREQHRLMRDNGATGECTILLTSDKGLAGSLNSAVIKASETHVRDHDKKDECFICLGKKGYEHFSRRGYEVVDNETNISDEVSLSDMEKITKEAITLFEEGKVGKVYIAYQSFISTFYQEPVVRQVLPLDREALEAMVKSITPESGKYSEEIKEERQNTYTVEPDDATVLEEIIPRLVEIVVYHAMLESKACEHSARMVAMKNASDKAKDVTKSLTLEFNKARQAAITAEVSEITGGIEALKT